MKHKQRLETIEKLRQRIITHGTLTQAEAFVFFSEKFEASTKMCRDLCGPTFTEDFPTNQFKKSGWRQGKPIGVCDHFTADASLVSTLRWFSSHKWKQPDGSMNTSKASSAFLVDLDGTSYCLIDFWNNKADWHEPQLNGLCLGIEHVNAGELHQKDGQFYSWPNNWTKSYPHMDSLPPVAQEYRGAQFFMPYTREQIVENIVLKRALVSMYGSTLRPEFFVDHAMYRTDKKDCGPHFPLSALRNAAFDKQPVANYGFMYDFPSYRANADKLPDEVAEPDLVLSTGNDIFETEISKVLWAQLTLHELGYKVPMHGQLDSETSAIIKKFQTQSNLSVDGIPGPKTRKALREATKTL